MDEALKGRDGRVRSVWVRLPVNAKHITDKGKAKTQHKRIKRGIEQVGLLEEAPDEHLRKQTKTQNKLSSSATSTPCQICGNITQK